MNLFFAIDLSGSMQEGAKQFIVLNLLNAVLQGKKLGLFTWETENIHILYIAERLEDHLVDDSFDCPMPSEAFSGSQFDVEKLLDYLSGSQQSDNDLFFCFTDQPPHGIKIPSNLHFVLVGDEYTINYQNNSPFLSPEQFAPYLNRLLEKTGGTA